MKALFSKYYLSYLLWAICRPLRHISPYTLDVEPNESPLFGGSTPDELQAYAGAIGDMLPDELKVVGTVIHSRYKSTGVCVTDGYNNYWVLEAV